MWMDPATQARTMTAGFVNSGPCWLAVQRCVIGIGWERAETSSLAEISRLFCWPVDSEWYLNTIQVFKTRFWSTHPSGRTDIVQNQSYIIKQLVWKYVTTVPGKTSVKTAETTFRHGMHREMQRKIFKPRAPTAENPREVCASTLQQKHSIIQCHKCLSHPISCHNTA